jgi:hypothetical protein
MTGNTKLALCIAFGPLVGGIVGLFVGSLDMGAAYGLLGGTMIGTLLSSLTKKTPTTNGGDDQPQGED